MNDARALTLSLHGQWHGRYGAAPCPICQPDRRRGQNALTLSDAPNGRLLAHCKKSGCRFADIVRALGLAPGDFARPDPADLARVAAEALAEAAKRARIAAMVWQETLPIRGTPAESYLRSRGLDLTPRALRFHPAAWHGPSARREPALVAFVQGSGEPAVHRTWLRPDGSGKADLEPNKAMLGCVQGGAVRLLDGAGPLVVAEGIETSLSLACGLLDGRFRLWAALSANGLRALLLPANPGALIIATDGDATGRAAGSDLASRAHALGWRVSFAHAPDGCDWNDILMKKGA